MTTRQQIQQRLAGGETPTDVARSLGLDYDADADAVVLPGWVADDGDAEIEYPDADSAAEAAQDYVDTGDWGEDGGDIVVWAWRIGLDEDGDLLRLNEERHTIHAPSEDERRDLELHEDGEVLASAVGEYSTEKLIRMDDDYFHLHENGGDRGAWDRQCGDGVWRDHPVEPTRTITRTEARALLLDWGYTATRAAAMTRTRR